MLQFKQPLFVRPLLIDVTKHDARVSQQARGGAKEGVWGSPLLMDVTKHDVRVGKQARGGVELSSSHRRHQTRR